MSKRSTINATALVKGIGRLGKAGVAAVERGLAKAGQQMVNDASQEDPRVPHREGTLRASASVHVQIGAQLVKKSGAGEGSPDVTVNQNSRVAVVGFNTVYAAAQHEGIAEHPGGKIWIAEEYTEPGAGPKFLEKKMQDFKDDYMAVVAEEVKGALAK